MSVDADKTLVNENELREELANLEAEEARVSAERRRLHQRIDFGYSVSGSLRARERGVSDERQALHRRIDELRKLLGIETVARSAAGKPVAVRELTPEVEPERLSR